MRDSTDEQQVALEDLFREFISEKLLQAAANSEGYEKRIKNLAVYIEDSASMLQAVADALHAAIPESPTKTLDRTDQSINPKETTSQDPIGWLLGHKLKHDSLPTSRVNPQLPALDALTQEEVDLIKLVMSDLTNKQIGAELGIGHRAVEHRMNAIRDKLGARSRTGAVVMAIHYGYVTVKTAHT